MLRPTPGRLLYLLIGLVIGGIALYAYIAAAGTPAFLPPLRGSQPTQRPSTEFTGTKLVKVLPVNQEVTKSGVLVRINSVEEYADGFSLTYSIIGGQPGEPAPVLQPDRFAVIDDRGGNYQLSAIGSAATVAPGLSAGYLSFAPALDPNARTLTVTVPHLMTVSTLGTAGGSQVIDGPWQVQVGLK